MSRQTNYEDIMKHYKYFNYYYSVKSYPKQIEELDKRIIEKIQLYWNLGNIIIRHITKPCADTGEGEGQRAEDPPFEKKGGIF